MWFGLVVFSLCCSCTSNHRVPAPKWSIAIHAGAGVIAKGKDQSEVLAYRDSLSEALAQGRKMLSEGATAMETVEEVVVLLEDNPLFNAGRGAVYNEVGKHELDASIMDGSNLSCGAVAGVMTVKNPIRLAKRVMTATRHVLLAGRGAEKFADTQSDIERVAPSYFDTEGRLRSLQRALKARRKSAANMKVFRRQELRSTVGCVVRDQAGNLAAATSTGGMTAKRWGRVGDSPLVGAGTYANNDTCAVSCTGTGEEYIRHGVAYDVAARMRYRGDSLEEAARAVVFEVLAKDDGGLIAVDSQGNMTLVFNTLGMFRGAADSSGHFEVAIWEHPLVPSHGISGADSKP